MKIFTPFILLAAVFISLWALPQSVAAQKRAASFQGKWDWGHILTGKEIKGSDVEYLKLLAHGDDIRKTPISSLYLELVQKGNKLTGLYMAAERFSDKLDSGDIYAVIKGNRARFNVESSHGGKATVSLIKKGNRLYWKVIKDDGGSYWFTDSAVLRRRRNVKE